MILAREAGFHELESEDIEEVLASHTEEFTKEDLQLSTEHNPLEDDDNDEKPQQTLTSKRLAKAFNMIQQGMQILINDDPNRKQYGGPECSAWGQTGGRKDVRGGGMSEADPAALGDLRVVGMNAFCSVAAGGFVRAEPIVERSEPSYKIKLPLESPCLHGCVAADIMDHKV
ncbi:putative Tigger transposable element-derived protein 1-like 277 [Homarus americanus]|uniref:Putative Tigger transposable element-derived protein 1-like 277 n=1 Tax=Homarus americanus TaxID=6706 RepID=A0A8J5N822_HOMAM|nr:putative Tigger transposable element-derived protein 1-like 277 [Homarus americanus]